MLERKFLKKPYPARGSNLEPRPISVRKGLESQFCFFCEVNEYNKKAYRFIRSVGYKCFICFLVKSISKIISAPKYIGKFSTPTATPIPPPTPTPNQDPDPGPDPDPDTFNPETPTPRRGMCMV